jgi:phosphoribosylformylglycinamidine synthase
MPYQTLIGNSCYTSTEAQKLLERINKQTDAKLQSIQGNWLYYIDLKKDQVGLDKVQQLLQVTNTSAPATTSQSENTVTFYITPRNISPWSSKATSIAHVCGLKDQVHRVERGRAVTIQYETSRNAGADIPFHDVIHDRMTETLATEQPSLDAMFAERERAPLVVVDIFADDSRGPLAILDDYNKKMGLALSSEEMQYLVESYTRLGRPPHDVELFMFAQVNSEYVSSKTIMI